MKRGRPLRSDPDKTKAWHDRTREEAIQRAKERDTGPSYMPSRRTPLNPGKRKSKARVPEQIRARVIRRTGGKCVRPGCGNRADHVHHWLDEQAWPALARLEANLSGVCFGCHWNHHYAPNGRLPYAAIPDCTLQLAATAGPKAQAHLQRYYPQDAARDI